MARGFIKGALWGACVGLGAVTLVSVAVEAPGLKGADSAEDIAAGLPRPASAPDSLTALSPDVDAPAAVPVTGEATALAAAEFNETLAQDGVAVQNGSAPRVASAPQNGLTTPTSDRQASISTDPAQPPLPTANVPQSAFDTADLSVSSAAPAAPSEPDAPSAGPGVDLTGDISTDPLQPTAPEAPTETASVGAQQTLLSEAEEPIATTEEPAAPAVDVATSVEDIDQPLASSERVVSAAPLPKEMASEENVSIDVAATDIVDAPQPLVVTDVSLPVSARVAYADAQAPKVANEAAAPELVAMLDIAEPSAADERREPEGSEIAEVRAEVTDLPIPVAPNVAENAVTATLPIGEIAQPSATPAPEALAQVIPDPVANPDQAQFVASAQASEAGAEVRINRLPSLGQQAPSEADEQPAEVQEDQPEPTLVRPFDRNAEPFDNPDDKPAMAIVLMDQGGDLSAAKIGLPALREFPYPVSFAVNAMAPDAAERIEAYRAEGFEVLATIDLPEGATAADAEVNMAVALERVPEVVGVLEGVETGVQTTRDSGRQVAQILAQSGHGFVTQNVGLNTVQKLAARDGVPSAVVFRDFDAKDQNERVIRRFLDQAAFKAGQEGGVVMLGRLREETISALLVWGLQDRASRVALSPVSAVLRADQ